MKFLVIIITAAFMLSSVITPTEKAKNVTQALIEKNEVSLSATYEHPGNLMKHAVKIIDVTETINVLNVSSTYTSSGSGVVIDVEGKKSLVLTVNHVCEDSHIPGQMLNKELVVKEEHFIITSKGKKLRVRSIQYRDPGNDICVVGVDGIAGVPASPAAFLPEPGDRIYSVGSPKGIWDKNLVHLIDGFFIGIRTKPLNGIFSNFAQYSLHSAPGASGSAIFHNGRIVGLLSHGNSKYKNVVWGPSLAQVRKATAEGITNWRNSL